MSAINAVQLRFWRLRRGSQSLLSKASRYWSAFGGVQQVCLSCLFPVLDRLFMDINADHSDGYDYEMFFGVLQIMMEIDSSLSDIIIQRYFKYTAQIETNLDTIVNGEMHRRNLRQYYVQISLLQKQFYQNIAPIVTDDLRVPHQEISNAKLLANNARRWASLKSLLRFDIGSDERDRAILDVFTQIEFSMKSWYDALFYIFDDAHFKAMAYGAANNHEFLSVCLIMKRMVDRRPEFIEYVWSQYGTLLLNYFRDDRIRSEIGDHDGIVSLLSTLVAHALQSNVSPENILSLGSYWLRKEKAIVRWSPRWNGLSVVMPAVLLAVVPVVFVIAEQDSMPNHLKMAIGIYSALMAFATWSGFNNIENRLKALQLEIYRVSVKLESNSGRDA